MSKPLTNAEKASDRRARKAEQDGNGRLESLFSGRAGGGAEWGSASPGRVLAVIVAMSALGGAVTFGLSRDGGAYMLTLLLDGNRKTDWLPQDGDLDSWLENWEYAIQILAG